MATQTDGAAVIVDRVFDRLAEYFPPPVYVGRMLATLMGAIVALVVVERLMKPVQRIRDEAKGDVVAEAYGTGLLLGTIVVGLLVQRMAANVFYNFFMISANKQHAANTHWIGEYTRAARQVF